MPEDKDSIIDSLPQQTYEDKPLETRGFVGEKSLLRRLDIHDRLDMQRIRDIDRNLPEQFEEPVASDKELIRDSIKEVKSNTDRLLFYVAGGEGVSQNEIGELQGWLVLAPEGKRQIQRLEKAGYIGELKEGQRIYEISYAKHRKAAPHQMASALRQVCAEISQMNAGEALQKIGNLQDPETVLKNIGEGNQPDTIVVAYVDPDNIFSISSMRVLDAAGFIQKGIIKYSGNRDNLVYVLDWKKLNTILHKKADKKILD